MQRSDIRHIYINGHSCLVVGRGQITSAWAGRSPAGPLGLPARHKLRGTVFRGAAGAFIELQVRAVQVTWSTSATLVLGDAAEDVTRDASVARCQRGERRLRSGRRSVQRVDRVDRARAWIGNVAETAILEGQLEDVADLWSKAHGAEMAHVGVVPRLGRETLPPLVTGSGKATSRAGGRLRERGEEALIGGFKLLWFGTALGEPEKFRTLDKHFACSLKCW